MLAVQDGVDFIVQASGLTACFVDAEGALPVHVLGQCILYAEKGRGGYESDATHRADEEVHAVQPGRIVI